jgi:hypothetical protein
MGQPLFSLLVPLTHSLTPLSGDKVVHHALLGEGRKGPAPSASASHPKPTQHSGNQTPKVPSCLSREEENEEQEESRYSMKHPSSPGLRCLLSFCSMLASLCDCPLALLILLKVLGGSKTGGCKVINRGEHEAATVSQPAALGS